MKTLEEYHKEALKFLKENIYGDNTKPMLDTVLKTVTNLIEIDKGKVNEQLIEEIKDLRKEIEEFGTKP